MPAPWTMVATFLAPSSRARSAAVADARRAASRPKPSCGPNPTTSTRRARILPAG